MSLLALQRAMRGDILADDDPAAPPEPGMAVYRNAYRGRLLEALQASFELTRRWAGDEGFDAAARHHVILNPPTGWTLDAYGATFDRTLHALFAQDADVAELAWLEWHMQQAFAAPDCAVLDAASLTGSDWQHGSLEFVPSFAMRAISTACVPLWLALHGDGDPPTELALAEPAWLIVWRQQMTPHFRVIDRMEHHALAAIAAGNSFEAMCSGVAELLVARDGEADAAAEAIGTMFGGWLRDGLLKAWPAR